MTFSNFFVPSSQTISSISNANPAVVTTSQNHGYSTGLIIRLYFPIKVGMDNLNNQAFMITVLSPTTFSIPVNSSNFNVFSPKNTKQLPQVIPVGDIAKNVLEATANNQNIIPET